MKISRVCVACHERSCSRFWTMYLCVICLVSPWPLANARFLSAKKDYGSGAGIVLDGRKRMCCQIRCWMRRLSRYPYLLEPSRRPSSQRPRARCPRPLTCFPISISMHFPSHQVRPSRTHGVCNARTLSSARTFCPSSSRPLLPRPGFLPRVVTYESNAHWYAC